MEAIFYEDVERMLYEARVQCPDLKNEYYQLSDCEQYRLVESVNWWTLISGQTQVTVSKNRMTFMHVKWKQYGYGKRKRYTVIRRDPLKKIDRPQ
jgi:hypothetical protein